MQSLPIFARGQAPRSGGDDPRPLILDRYRLLERLGAGGFGVVWRARDEHEQRDVAVKRIPLGPGADPARAAREAMAVGRLSHPAIVCLYDARCSQDAFYLVSELVHGGTLAQLFRCAPPGDEQLLEIIACVAHALSHAHARGVIHRDVKPPNILVPEHPAGAEARAKLTDFGGAQLTGEDALTRTGDVVGTLAYMAPEQAEGRGATPSSDLYSLALVLYEGLTGSNPIRGAGPADTVRRLGQPLPSLGLRRPDLSPGLVDVVDAALDPRPADRGRLQDLGEALRHGPPGAGRAPRVPRRVVRGAFGAAERRPAATPTRPSAAVRDEHGPPLGRVPRLAGALAAGALMAGALRLVLLDPSYAPLGGAVTALLVALAPRVGWLAGSAFIVLWLVVSGSPGTGLVVACAALPVALALRRPGPAWSLPVLAPLLGLIGLGAAYPALAARARGTPRRAAVGALGFWWLMLAQPLTDRRLWLGPPTGTFTRAAWEHTISGAARHALEPLLVPGMLAGALLWALAAAALPVVLRGRSAARDLAAVGAWGSLLALGAVSIEHGLSASATTPWPRGLVGGTVAGALITIGLRALPGRASTLAPARGATRARAPHPRAGDDEGPF